MEKHYNITMLKKDYAHKTCIHSIIALCLLFAVQVSVAQVRGFGFGIIIGDPTGISAKLWTSTENAFDFSLGWSVMRVSQVHFHLAYRWHSFVAFHSSGRFSFYYGIGGRFITCPGYNGSEEVRGIYGIAWMPHNTPIDLFLEIAQTLQFLSSNYLEEAESYSDRIAIMHLGKIAALRTSKELKRALGGNGQSLSDVFVRYVWSALDSGETFHDVFAERATAQRLG